MFNAEEHIEGLTAHELSELRALLNSDEYTDLIEQWRSEFDRAEYGDDEY